MEKAVHDGEKMRSLKSVASVADSALAQDKEHY